VLSGLVTLLERFYGAGSSGAIMVLGRGIEHDELLQRRTVFYTQVLLSFSPFAWQSSAAMQSDKPSSPA